ncbi:MAG: phage holin family protein [Clostridia bacterium]|nr:phage holin family protein [Clostridia bacterium]
MKLFYTMLEWAGDFFTDVWGWAGACVGMVISLWTGMPALGRGILIVQGADILSGLACALLGKSLKSESGKVSSRVMLEGMIKKGAEWLIVLVCVYTGTPLGMEGICSAAMTYVIATELVSLLENMALLGLDVPLLKTILDVAHGGYGEETKR